VIVKSLFSKTHPFSLSVPYNSVLIIIKYTEN